MGFDEISGKLSSEFRGFRGLGLLGLGLRVGFRA